MLEENILLDKSADLSKKLDNPTHIFLYNQKENIPIVT